MLQFHSWYQFVTSSIQRRVIFWWFFPMIFLILRWFSVCPLCLSLKFIINHQANQLFKGGLKGVTKHFIHTWNTKKQMLSMDNPWLMKNRGFSPVIATKAGILDIIKSPWVSLTLGWHSEILSVSYLDPSWPFFLLISETSGFGYHTVGPNLSPFKLVLPRPSF